MRYRLLCIDVDGTLLTDDKRIGVQDIEALRRASEQGIRIALITGRMPAAADMIAEQLEVPCILACNAGTYIIREEQCIHSEHLPLAAMTGIYEDIRPFGTPLWIFMDRQWFVTAKDHYVKNEENLVSYVSEEVSMEELAAKWRREQVEPNKLLVGADAAVIQDVYAVLRERRDVDMACSSENYLEIFPRGMNKGKALRLICEEEKIGIKETVAFGDQELDIPMLKAAGIAVAMGNAIEEAKQIADFITRSNNEAGIAYALEHLLS